MRFYSEKSINDIDPKSKWLLRGILAPFVALCIFVVYREVRDSPPPEETFRMETEKLAFHARVDSLYIEKMNHGVTVAVLSNKTKFTLWDGWEPLVEVGDTLHKKLGTMKVIALKKTGGTDTLDFLPIYEAWKKRNE